MSEDCPDDLLEFLALWLGERETGSERTLPDYQALFPRSADAIAQEWERARSPAGTLGPLGSLPSRVAGFRLVRELGRGGQARVWLAEDERLQRRVALKLVPRSPFAEDLAPRLLREVRVSSRLDHPGLCTVYDAGLDGTLAWIALRYVEGETLGARLAAERAGRRERTPVERVLREGEALARALAVAHEAGIVHRDVKPGNVMIAPDGEPVLLDFGVALADDGGVPLTLTGEQPGTPAYMAPELLDGRAPADARSDVWSLGVTLFEALTLARPFEAPTRAAEARAVIAGGAPDPRTLRPALDRDVSLVLLTALAARPQDRYATALDLAEDLRRAREHEPLRARPAGPGLRLLRWAQRRPALAGSLAALALALVGGLGVSLSQWVRARDALAESEALFGDVSHLADSLAVARLIDGFPALWPALDTRAEGFAAWLDGADRFLSHLPESRTVLAAARARLSAGRARPTDEWLAAGLAELLARRADVDALAPRVAAGLEFARSVRRRSIEDPDARARWERAAHELSEDRRFAGVALAPQLGLLPLGRDPASGLQEFAHLASGTPPERGADGVLRLDAASGVVLVLLPGGGTRIGAVPVDDGHAAGEPHVDPLAWRWDGPVVHVRLDPFFLARHELTQGQWMRHAARNPSAYQASSSPGLPEGDERHPVESVSWDESQALLAELDLALPSEAQWEYGARAGSTTPWWTGETRDSLAGAANLADESARERATSHGWQIEAGHEDGFLVHAPVGSMAPNAFGLHDVAGNVAEWCADGFEDWAAVPPRDGDGRAPGHEPTHPERGGHFTSDAVRARTSARDGYEGNVRSSYIGLRAARPLRPGGS